MSHSSWNGYFYYQEKIAYIYLYRNNIMVKKQKICNHNDDKTASKEKNCIRFKGFKGFP